jgi:hypothetical protein
VPLKSARCAAVGTKSALDAKSVVSRLYLRHTSVASFSVAQVRSSSIQGSTRQQHTSAAIVSSARVEICDVQQHSVHMREAGSCVRE